MKKRQPPAPRAATEKRKRLELALALHQSELEKKNEEAAQLAREQLQKALAGYTELYDVAPVAYLTLKPSGIIKSLDHAAARLLGKERDLLTGMPFSLLAPESAAQLTQFFAPAPAGESIKHEAVLPGLPHAQLTATRLQCGDLLLVMEDVGEQRRATAALKEASERKDEFLGALSHELRNPLAPIRTGLALLKQLEPAGPIADRALASIDRQVTHLAHILDDLLDMTRISRGKIELQRCPTEIGTIAREILEDYQAIFTKANVTLNTMLTVEPLWVNADATRIMQAIGNLLVNAAKFTPPEGHVEVALRGEDGQAILSVSDSGVGIEPELLARLFTPFTQGAQPLSRTRGGLGLGLAMVKGLVELHGGSVQVKSRGHDRGAAFVMSLPLTTPPAELPRQAPKASVQGGHRVLVVEDHEDAAELLRYALEHLGHEVRVAADGEEGLVAVNAFAPELILCDLGMPNVDGFELARRYRAQGGTAYLVAVSGYALAHDVRRAREAGFDQHAAKPLSNEALGDILREVFSSATPVTTH